MGRAPGEFREAHFEVAERASGGDVRDAERVAHCVGLVVHDAGNLGDAAAYLAELAIRSRMRLPSDNVDPSSRIKTGSFSKGLNGGRLVSSFHGTSVSTSNGTDFLARAMRTLRA